VFLPINSTLGWVDFYSTLVYILNKSQMDIFCTLWKNIENSKQKVFGAIVVYKKGRDFLSHSRYEDQ
jgi:hypothetical protein